MRDARGLAHAFRHRQERVADEHRGRVGVVEDVGHLLRGEAVVHRDADGAERAQGGPRDEVLERVVGVHDGVLAGADAEGAERVGETVPRTEKLLPRQRSLALHEGGPVRVLRGVRGDDGIGTG